MPNRIASVTVFLENVVPFAGVPFVRALARLEIEMVWQNVGLGCRNQREANARALEREDSDLRALSDLNWLSGEAPY